MSVCTESKRYQNIRSQRAPVGVKCPHCQTEDQVFYSSAQLRRPLHKRMLYAYLRCYACTQRFRHLKVHSLIFMGIAIAIFAVAGMMS